MSIVKGFDSRGWDGYLPSGTGFKFVGIKISQGTSFNPSDMWKLQRQWEWSKERYGLLRMPFHYLTISNWRNPEEFGIQQAEYFFTSIMEKFGNDYGELPPVIDAEYRPLYKNNYIARTIKAALERTEELWGRKPIIYTAGWYWDTWVYPYYHIARIVR